MGSQLNKPVFTTKLSATVTVHNLKIAVNALVDELDLKTSAHGSTRILHSWRSFYTTLNPERGVTKHSLSSQLGNSTETIDRHYSKYNPLMKAEGYSSWKKVFLVTVNHLVVGLIPAAGDNITNKIYTLHNFYRHMTINIYIINIVWGKACKKILTSDLILVY